MNEGQDSLPVQEAQESEDILGQQSQASKPKRRLNGPKSGSSNTAATGAGGAPGTNFFKTKKMYGMQIPVLTLRNPKKDYKAEDLQKYRTKIQSFEAPLNSGKFPAWLMQFATRRYKNNQLQKYMSQVQQEGENQNSVMFKGIQKMMPGAVEFKDGKWIIKDNQKLTKRLYNANDKQAIVKNLDESTKIMGKSLTSDQVNTYIPPLVTQVISANSIFSAAGVGPKSANSLPLYAGRWVDDITGRIRLLPKASSKYLNPLSYEQRFQYYQARLLNKWNEYVDAEYNLLKFRGMKNKEQFPKKQAQRIQRSLNVSKLTQKALKWMKNQIILFTSAIPLTQSSRIVLGAVVSADKLQAFYTLVSKLLEDKNQKDPQKQIREFLVGIFEAEYGNFKGKAATSQNVKTFAKASDAFAVWINKVNGPVGRAVRQVIKASIPTTLDQQNVEEVVEKFDQLREEFLKRGRLTEKDVESLKTMIKTPTKSIQDFTQRATQLQKLTSPFERRPTLQLQAQFAKALKPTKRKKKYVPFSIGEQLVPILG